MYVRVSQSLAGVATCNAVEMATTTGHQRVIRNGVRHNVSLRSVRA